MRQEEGLRRVTVVGALSSAVERQALGRILDHSKWQLRFADGLQSVHEQLKDLNEAVIICDRFLPDGSNWRDVLDECLGHGISAHLIVAERNADDCLWAEVLNVGAYDLLMKPFRSEEVFHAISAAWRALPARSQSWQPSNTERRLSTAAHR